MVRRSLWFSPLILWSSQQQWTCMFLCDGEQGSREYLTNYKHIFPDFILQFHGVVAENHIHVRVRHVEVKNHKHHLDVTACGQTRLPKETACL